MPLKEKTLNVVRKQVQSLMQPLYDDAASAREESNRRIATITGRLSALEQSVQSLTESVLYSRWMNEPDALASRREAGYWLNWIGLAGEGVEVGVYRGEYSAHLLRTWEGARLTSIDPWREFPAADYVDTCNASQEQHDRNHAKTAGRLAPFEARSRILRMTSSEAAVQFDDGSLDFVYLDAQHHYDAVRNDIGLWCPKVHSGGVIGGHDYLDGILRSGHYGVKKAVDEFVATNGYTVTVTKESKWPSWFVRIP